MNVSPHIDVTFQYVDHKKERGTQMVKLTGADISLPSYQHTSDYEISPPFRYSVDVERLSESITTTDLDGIDED